MQFGRARIDDYRNSVHVRATENPEADEGLEEIVPLDQR